MFGLSGAGGRGKILKIRFRGRVIHIKNGCPQRKSGFSTPNSTKDKTQNSAFYLIKT